MGADPSTGLDLDDHGNIILFPLAGYQTRTLPQANILLALSIVPHEQAFQTGERRSVQIGIRAPQARELAQALLRAADATEMGQAPTTTRN
jgi:hypothetical protein